MKIYITFICLLGLLSCKKPLTSIIIQPNTELTFMDKWTVIGPFYFDTLTQKPTTTYLNKDLQQFGIDEACFTPKDLAVIEEKRVNTFPIDTQRDLVDLFSFHQYKNKNAVANYYLYTSIFSEKETLKTLIFDGSRNYKVWLNCQKILEVTGKDNIRKLGDTFINVKLKKGTNHILVKINRGTNQYSWRFIAAITSLTKAKEMYRDNYMSDFISAPVIKDSVNCYLGPYNNANLQILIGKNIVMAQSISSSKEGTCRISCQSIKDGLYTSKLIIGKDTLTQAFFKGDIFSFIDSTNLASNKLLIDTHTVNDLQAVNDRLTFLKTNWNVSSKSAKRYYHRNTVYWTQNLVKLYAYIQLHGHDKRLAGTTLKTYTSPKNDSTYQFLFHVDNDLLKAKVPLVIIAPYTSVAETMASSWYLGNLDQHETDFRIADKYGFAVCMLFMRGNKYTTSAAIDDLNNTLKRLYQDYSIDSSQIYIAGSCEGGKRALLAAMHQPDYFAGVATSSPITIGNKGVQPANFMHNLNHVPVHISHGIYDKTVSIEMSREYVQLAKENNLPVRLKELPNSHTLLSNEARKDAFYFFDSLKSRKQQLPIPHHIKYTTYSKEPINVYWLQLVKDTTDKKADIQVEFDSDNYTFRITANHISTYTLNINKLLLKEKSIKIYTNGKLSYEGVNDNDDIKISLNTLQRPL